MSKSVWITWDDHRRSRELASYWGVEYKVLEHSGSAFVRYTVLLFRTVYFLSRAKPDIIICQNPSVILAAFLTLLSRLQGFYLIVDRHSNFKIACRNSRSLKWKIFHWVSDYSLRRANLTIVTNNEASDYVSSYGAKSVILPDKLPSDLSAIKIELEGDVNFLFICSFSRDEPLESVLNCFKRLSEQYHVYVTGNYKKNDSWTKYRDVGNIHFLGFVAEQEYLNYLESVDATIVLTDMSMTLNCGSYESVKAGKPQVVADSPVIREWFSRGAVYVDPKDEASILHGITQAIERLDELRNEQVEFSNVIHRDWCELDAELHQLVYEASGHQL